MRSVSLGCLIFVIAVLNIQYAIAEDYDTVKIQPNMPSDLIKMFESKEDGKVREMHARFLLPKTTGKWEIKLPKTSRVSVIKNILC